MGREMALLAKLVSAALLYALGRRVGMHPLAVAVTVLLFALSPLSLYFQRMALLDNMLLPWVLAAFVLALSPQRRLIAYTGSAACLGDRLPDQDHQRRVPAGAGLPPAGRESRAGTAATR